MAQRKFAQCLGEFQFEYIGDAKTDDEKCIGKCGFSTGRHSSPWKQPLYIFVSGTSFKCVLSAPVFTGDLFRCMSENYRFCFFLLPDESLQEFSSFLRNLEDQRELMVRTASQNLPESPEEYLWVCMHVSYWPSICLRLWMGYRLQGVHLQITPPPFLSQCLSAIYQRSRQL